MDIRCVINAIEAFAPRALQESYDNSGLQAGDVTKDCKGVLLTLDVSEQTVEEAASLGCNLIISHHPLLFKGIKTLTPASSTGRILISAVKNDIAIYSAHTNLDNARRGVSARMAAKLGMTDVEVLRSNYYTYFENVWTKFHHLRSTTLKDHDSAKEAINQAHAYALEQGTFDQKVFYEAFGIFDNQSIEKSLVSQNPLVRIFALLDRRLGKRHLLALEKSMEQELDWVRAFYVIRMQAEGLMEKE